MARWENPPQVLHVIHFEIKTVEAITDIIFGHENGAIYQVFQYNLLQDVIKGMAKLYGFCHHQ